MVHVRYLLRSWQLFACGPAERLQTGPKSAGTDRRVAGSSRSHAAAMGRTGEALGTGQSRGGPG